MTTLRQAREIMGRPPASAAQQAEDCRHGHLSAPVLGRLSFGGPPGARTLMYPRAALREPGWLQHAPSGACTTLRSVIAAARLISRCDEYQDKTAAGGIICHGGGGRVYPDLFVAWHSAQSLVRLTLVCMQRVRWEKYHCSFQSMSLPEARTFKSPSGTRSQ